jgi:hypothetical protein
MHRFKPIKSARRLSNATIGVRQAAGRFCQRHHKARFLPFPTRSENTLDYDADKFQWVFHGSDQGDVTHRAFDSGWVNRYFSSTESGETTI